MTHIIIRVIYKWENKIIIYRQRLDKNPSRNCKNAVIIVVLQKCLFLQK